MTELLLWKTTAHRRYKIPMNKHRKQPVQTEPLVNFQAANTDPQGSWTGVPADLDEVPVQDADDL